MRTLHKNQHPQRVFETRTYPHARTLRTSFSQKLVDCFETIAASPETGYGLFDYLTLFIPLILLVLMLYIGNQEKGFAKGALLMVPLILINVPLVIARLVFAAAVTLLFSPVTAIIHGFSRFFSKESRDAVLALQGCSASGRHVSLGEYLRQEKLDLENLNVHIELKPIQIKSEKKMLYLFSFWKENQNLAVKDPPSPSFMVAIGEDAQGRLSQNMHALLSLNIGHVVSHIESSEMSEAAKRHVLSI